MQWIYKQKPWIVSCLGVLITLIAARAFSVVNTQTASAFIEGYFVAATIEPVSNCYKVTTHFEVDILCLELDENGWKFVPQGDVK